MIRDARLADVPAIRDLISSHAELGRMLFREPAELYRSLREFKVCEQDGKLIGCGALQIVWADLAEVKSLAVSNEHLGRGAGSKLLEAIIEQARQLELPKIFTLTLEPEFFEKFGFERVDKESLPYKVWSDCAHCPKQDQCDETAMVLKL
jgi:amino-acid N-acetyltransferase